MRETTCVDERAKGQKWTSGLTSLSSQSVQWSGGRSGAAQSDTWCSLQTNTKRQSRAPPAQQHCLLLLCDPAFYYWQLVDYSCMCVFLTKNRVLMACMHQFVSLENRIIVTYVKEIGQVVGYKNIKSCGKIILKSS